MKNDIVKEIMRKRRIPEIHRETIQEVLTSDDPESIIDQLDVLEAHCYRMDPCHPRYV